MFEKGWSLMSSILDGPLETALIILHKADLNTILNSCKKSSDRIQSLNPWKWATPIYRFSRYHDLCFSAPDGRRDFPDGAKCSQWQCLFWCCEATYTSKCLLSEKIAKNWFSAFRQAKISFSPFSRKVSNLGYMLLHNSYINVAIAVILMGRKSLYDLHKLR